MQTFATLLSLFYICDTAAATRGLSPSEVTACMANYERLKLEFVTGTPAPIGTPERAAQNREGYSGWKAWERKNADLVQDLREQAARLLQTG